MILLLRKATAKISPSAKLCQALSHAKPCPAVISTGTAMAITLRLLSFFELALLLTANLEDNTSKSKF